jgi:hypothetical protein
MRYELKSIRTWSFFKIAFFINLIMGFLFGVLYALMIPLLVRVADLVPGLAGDLGYLSDMSFGMMLIIIPISFAIQAALFLTLIGVVAIGLYNLIARLVGGLHLELGYVEPVGQPPSPTPPVAAPVAPLPSVAIATSPAPPSAAPPPRPSSPDAPPGGQIPPAPSQPPSQ